MAVKTKKKTKKTIPLNPWEQELARIGAEKGFYEKLDAHHTALYVKGGKTLIVTFENIDNANEGATDRMPWGYDFVLSQGWSMLGMMAHSMSWYRSEEVHDFFDRLKKSGFFKQFDHVVFYGASMGAYGAAIFSAAAKGSTVICISPQATLDRSITNWEVRFKKAWIRDFSSRYSYAPDQVKDAKIVHLFYDPYDHLDSMHAALFQSSNVVKYKCNFMGHRIASLWQGMRVLKPIVLGAVSGTMTKADFYQLIRKRKDDVRYQKEMLIRLRDMQRPELTILLCEYVLARRIGPHFRRALREARLAVANKAKISR